MSNTYRVEGQVSEDEDVGVEPRRRSPLVNRRLSAAVSVWWLWVLPTNVCFQPIATPPPRGP